MASFRNDANILIDSVKNEKNIPESTLHQYLLETKYIGSDAIILSDPHFEKGVVILQKGLSAEITENEKDAVVFLLNENSGTASSAAENQNPSVILTMKERLEKLRKKDEGEDQYRI